MEIRIKANVPCSWKNATTLATAIQTTLSESNAMFEFATSLCGKKETVIDSAGTKSVKTSYFVRANIFFEPTDFASAQTIEDSIYTACNTAKTSDATMKFESLTS